MGPVIRNVIRDVIRPVMGDEVLGSRFTGILDQVPGAVFAIAPYTQLSKAQTQSIEVRETGGDTEETFGPESQAAIDAFVGSNDGRIATAYNAGSEAANAVQATASNQPFIATAGVLEDGMRFAGGQHISTIPAGSTFMQNDFTICGWAKIPFGDETSLLGFVNTGNTTSILLNTNRQAVGGRVIFVTRREDGTTIIITIDDFFADDVWFFYTLTKSGGNYEAFSNLISKDTWELGGDYATLEFPMFLGARNNRGTAADPMTGETGTFAVWPRVLTSAELTKVYNATDPR